MKNMNFAYFGVAAIWLIINMLPIPQHLINEMELVKIALMIVIVVMAFRRKKNK